MSEGDSKLHILKPSIVGNGYVLHPDDVLQDCIGKLQSVVIAGLDENGELLVCSSHDIANSAMLTQRAALHLMGVKTAPLSRRQG